MVLGALAGAEMAMRDVGIDLTLGSGVAAAQAHFRKTIMAKEKNPQSRNVSQRHIPKLFSIRSPRRGLSNSKRSLAARGSVARRRMSSRRREKRPLRQEFGLSTERMLTRSQALPSTSGWPKLWIRLMAGSRYCV